MGTYEQAAVGEPVSTGDPKILTQLKGMNEELDSSNDLQGTGISKGFLGRFYPPTIIATEQTRENVAFGTLTTADEVKNVVLPENGLIMVAYLAKVKSSVAGNGRAAIFLNAVQLKNNTEGGLGQELETGTAFGVVSSGPPGLLGTGGAGAFTTTGMAVTNGPTGNGGFCMIFAAAGTYNVSIQFKSTPSGTVTAKERKLWVGVIGGI